MLHSVSPVMDAWGCLISYLVALGYTHISAQIDVCMMFWLMMNLGYYTSVNNNQTFKKYTTMPPCSGAIFFYIMQVLGLNPENTQSNNFQTLLGQFLLGFWCLMYFVYAKFSFFFFLIWAKIACSYGCALVLPFTTFTKTMININHSYPNPIF